MKKNKPKIEIHEKNEVFEKLENNLSLIETLSPSLKMDTYTTPLASTVHTKHQSILRIHDSITFELIEFPNTLIRIASVGKDGIEITRVCVDENHQGKKLGTYMMNTLFLFMFETLGYIPKIFLECIGSIKVGEETYTNPIQLQTKFFRKFGFRVSVNKFYPDYVKMVFDESKFNSDNLHNEGIDLDLVA